MADLALVCSPRSTACSSTAASPVPGSSTPTTRWAVRSAGSADLPTPPTLLRELADGVQHGRYAELSGAGHLAPAEAPVAVAQLIAWDALISRIN
jgi:3-oxoadipate enol-lactonase/4-carboxymuconolactone decarboxylase